MLPCSSGRAASTWSFQVMSQLFIVSPRVEIVSSYCECLIVKLEKLL